jgi:hypothetical protein
MGCLSLPKLPGWPLLHSEYMLVWQLYGWNAFCVLNMQRNLETYAHASGAAVAEVKWHIVILDCAS